MFRAQAQGHYRVVHVPVANDQEVDRNIRVIQIADAAFRACAVQNANRHGGAGGFSGPTGAGFAAQIGAFRFKAIGGYIGRMGFDRGDQSVLALGEF